MTTQALSLVTAAHANAPVSASAVLGTGAHEFALVLAAQYDGRERNDDLANGVPAFHRYRGSLTEPSEHTLELEQHKETDTPLNIVAVALFVATESANLQQGLQTLDAGELAVSASAAQLPEDKVAILSSHHTKPDNAGFRQDKPGPKVYTQLTTPKNVIPHLATQDAALVQPHAQPLHSVHVAVPPSENALATVKPSVTTDAHSSLSNPSKTLVSQAVPVPLAFSKPAEAPTMTDISHGFTAVAIQPETITASPLQSTPHTSALWRSSLSYPLDTPAWGQEFSKTMVHISQHNIQHAELRLDPPELGPLRISLKLSDNIAHAFIVSAHANVRHAVEQALPQLHHALAQTGLSLGHTDVSDQPSHNPFLFASQTDDGEAAPSAARTFDAVFTESRTSSEPTTTPHRRPQPHALIDTFV